MQTGIVVPTLGTRFEYLKLCLDSIRKAGTSFILIVAPRDQVFIDQLDESLFDQVVFDPNLGLAAAIDLGIRSLPSSVLFVNWLGDDDLLSPNSLKISSEVLRSDPRIVLVYGGCNYIDENSNLLWSNRSGRFAPYLLKFGPQLIPQPGALMRRDVYMSIGGLNSVYKWAFDLDLFIRLRRIGRFRFIDSTLASFRWHEGSLSVGTRRGSVNEASRIRRNAHPRILQILSLLWEYPLRILIFNAGKVISGRSNRSVD